MVTVEDEALSPRAYILRMKLLRSIHAHVRAWDPRRVDALIALVFLVEAELEVLLLMQGAHDAWAAALIEIPLAAALALRRRSPSLSLALALAAYIAFQP